jgi:hypothetical protein
MTETIDRRDYGKLEAQVEQLTADVHELKQTVMQMRDMMSQARGGWRTAMLIGGMGAALATAAGYVINHIRIL